MTEANLTTPRVPDDKNVPVSAIWLGATGAIPFVACALVSVAGPQEWTGLALKALAYYGAVILSFLGGIQWGLAIGGREASQVSGLRLSLSVVPSLIGWAALLMPIPQGLLTMIAAFSLVLFLDLQATQRNEAPAWYPRLRIPPSAVAIASLTIAAIASA